MMQPYDGGDKPVMACVDLRENWNVVQDLQAVFLQRLEALEVAPPAGGWVPVARDLSHDAYESLRARKRDWVLATSDMHRLMGAPGA